ncbi:MAG: extracellular solute-binding protein [Planctomycetes bacterium]|nr:extracellular solute-binding protein [Planctomycetota bacterium]
MFLRCQIVIYFFIACALAAAGCSKPGVVIYTSADQTFAEPLLAEFEQKTGVVVQAVYDIEAAKTVGLVRTLLEERSHPRCDVFWNNELIHTMRLASAGLLAPYASPAAADIPAAFKDPKSEWTAFAARARVFIINKDLVKPEDYPKNLGDLLIAKWRGKIGVARPLSGTTLSHFAILYEVLGVDRTRDFIKQLIANDANLPSGNAYVAELVAGGQLAFGLTDTDDYETQRAAGKHVDVVYPGAGGDGTVVLPNSVALIKDCPHPENGKKLIDFLLGRDVERRLAFSDSANIPVRDAVESPPHVKRIGNITIMSAPMPKVAENLDARLDDLKSFFLK